MDESSWLENWGEEDRELRVDEEEAEDKVDEKADTLECSAERAADGRGGGEVDSAPP